MSENTPALRRLLDVALALGAERRTEPAMRAILAAARDLADAKYAAIGVPDGDGGFALFLTSGIDSATWDRIGALPRTHGLLGALLCHTEPIKLADITADERFRGYPAHHPWMRSFLGVPIVAGGEVVAELFLADKRGGAQFTDEDQRLLEMLAAHAALAVVNAQRHERARELSMMEERTRIARELHDSATQTLFSLTLVAESAATVAAAHTPDPDKLAAQLDQVRDLSRAALEEMRTLVETLRGGDIEREGLDDALRRRVDLLRAVHDVPIELHFGNDVPRGASALGREVFKVANEALSNALQHAEAASIDVRVDSPTDQGGTRLIRLVVADDGTGFDLDETARQSRRLGLVSMRERAKAMGAALRIDTAPGAGTRVTLEVPRGH